MYKTIEAVYKDGYLKPLEPIEYKPGIRFLVVIIDKDRIKPKTGHLGEVNDENIYDEYLSTRF
ncbi:MAG: antitoxin family protein [Methanosarcinales archaeon]